MPSITQRISQFINKFLPPSNPPTTSDELPIAKQSFVKLLNQQSEATNRQAMIRACRAMYDTDARVMQPISQFSSDLIGTGFTITVNQSTVGSDKAKAQVIIDDLIKRLNLQSDLIPFISDAQINGDSFVELSFDKSGLIQNLTSKPQLYFFRRTDTADQFISASHAYYYSEYGYYLNEPPIDDTSVIWFADWQVIHLRANFLKKGRYGTPTFRSAVSAWEKLQRGEANVDLNRAKFSQMIKVHRLTNYTQADVDSYIERNETALAEPFAVASEYFVTGEGGIEVLNSANDGLGGIEDLYHFLRAVESASPVPTSLLEVLEPGGGLSTDSLKYKLASYYQRVRSTRSWVADGLIKPLVERQLAALGIYPASIDYEILFNDSEMLESIINQGLSFGAVAQAVADA